MWSNDIKYYEKIYFDFINLKLFTGTFKSKVNLSKLGARFLVFLDTV